MEGYFSKLRFARIFSAIILSALFFQEALADTWNGYSTSRPTYYSDYGGRSNVVVIRTAAELAYARDHWDDDSGDGVGKDYYEHNMYLEADLDMRAANWTPMGGAKYKGTFYGNGHTISIGISNVSDNYQGLFAEIHSEGKVQDLHISGYIRCDNSRLVGGICGQNDGTIQNCWVSANVSSDWKESASSYTAKVGGIAGENNGTIQFCCMSGDVTNNDADVGGIAGYNSSSATINHVTFYGSRWSTHSQNNEYVGDQSGKLWNQHGSDLNNVDIWYSYLKSFSDNNVYRLAVDKTWADTHAKWTDAGNYSPSFSHTDGNNIYIESEADLALLAVNVNAGNDYLGKTFILTRDLNLGGKDWTPIGMEERPFKGNFDGKNHVISNVTVHRNCMTSYNGLFGWVEGWVYHVYEDPTPGSQFFRNLFVKNTEIRGGDFTGSIAGRIHGGLTVDSVFLDNANVVGWNSTAGFFGSAEGDYEQDLYVSNYTELYINNCLFVNGRVKQSTDPIDYALYERHSYVMFGNIQRYARFKNDFFAQIEGETPEDYYNVRAYPITLNVPSNIKCEFLTTPGLNYNGNFYLPNSTRFRLSYNDVTRFITSVKVNGVEVGTSAGEYTFSDCGIAADSYTLTVECNRDGFSGSGTEEDPYLITSTDFWNLFVDNVKSGESFSGKFLKLTADIEIDKMVGVIDSLAFSGTFLGDGHTITANINDTVVGKEFDISAHGVAPFRFINSATIKDLTIAGTISSVNSFMSGLAGYADGYNTIENCVVTATLNLGAQHAGGFIGHGRRSRTTIKDCVFAGTFNGIGESKPYIGGIWGWSYYGYWSDAYSSDRRPILINCLEKGTYNNIKSMHPIGLMDDIGNLTDCYYLNPTFGNPTSMCKLGGAAQAYVDIPGAGLFKKVKAADNNFYYVYFGSSDDGKTYNVTKNTSSDYRLIVKGEVVLNLGDNTTLNAHKGIELSADNNADLTINGPGALTIDNCDGDNAGIGAYRVGKLTINGGTLNVTGGDCAAALGGNRNNIEGGTIIINGGVVDVKGGNYAAGIGGGFDSWAGNYGVCGDIVINGGQVTARNGVSAPGIGPGDEIGGDYFNSGTLTIGWTNLSDFVYCTGFKNAVNSTLNSITFVDGKQFLLDGTETIATADNMEGKKIVPYYQPLPGKGSEDNPYVISSTEDWNSFEQSILFGYSYSGKYVKLTADIDINTTVGNRENYPFSGTFLGDGHTITANINSTTNGTGYNEQAVAPFHYIKDATIKNLTVAGTIASASYHTSGLVGFADGTNFIEGCTVTATFNIGSNYAGGLMGHGLNSSTTIKDCVFAGTINGIGDSRENIGGIWGWSDSGIPTLVNCLEYGTYNNISSMHPMGLQKNAGTITDCYFVTSQIGEPRNACTVSGAKQVYTTPVANGLYRPIGINKYNVYCKLIEAVNDGIYDVTENMEVAERITVGGTVVLNLGEGATLHAPKGIELSSSNNADLTINGPGALTIDNCDSDIAGIGAYRVGKLTINSGTLDVTGGRYGAALGGSINNVEGGTITINGGVVNAKGSNYAAGIGGGYDSWKGNYGVCGDIVINGGQVTALNGTLAPAIGPGYELGDTPYNSGTLTIGWTDPDDFIHCSSFVNNRNSTLNSITIAEGKTFVLEDEPVVATTENIGGKKMVPAVAICDGAANSEAQSAYNGVSMPVVLKDRTLYKDGTWATITLPFDLTLSGSVLDGAEAHPLVSAEITENQPAGARARIASTTEENGTTLNLTVGDAVSELEAGTPYIIKWAKADDYVNDEAHNVVSPVFGGVTIDNADRGYDNGVSGANRVRFTGTYDEKDITADDANSVLMLGDELQPNYAVAGVKIGASNAYLELGEDGESAHPTSFNIEIGDVPTSITTIEAEMEDNDDWYTIDGRYLGGKPTVSGIYIHGHKKVIIK